MYSSYFTEEKKHHFLIFASIWLALIRVLNARLAYYPRLHALISGSGIHSHDTGIMIALYCAIVRFSVSKHFHLSSTFFLQHTPLLLRFSRRIDVILLSRSFHFQGHPRLVNAIANLYGPLFNRKLDPLTEVSVSFPDAFRSPFFWVITECNQSTSL